MMIQRITVFIKASDAFRIKLKSKAGSASIFGFHSEKLVFAVPAQEVFHVIHLGCQCKEIKNILVPRKKNELMEAPLNIGSRIPTIQAMKVQAARCDLPIIWQRS